MLDDCVIYPLLFGRAVATPEATLRTMDMLRQALEYLEGRYAHQLAAAKAPPIPAPAKPPRVAKAANGSNGAAPRKRRGRPAAPSAPPPQPEMFGQPTVESGSG